VKFSTYFIALLTILNAVLYMQSTNTWPFSKFECVKYDENFKNINEKALKGMAIAMLLF
jgi:hypothetical protein